LLKIILSLYCVGFEDLIQDLQLVHDEAQLNRLNNNHMDLDQNTLELDAESFVNPVSAAIIDGTQSLAGSSSNEYPAAMSAFFAANQTAANNMMRSPTSQQRANAPLPSSNSTHHAQQFASLNLHHNSD
jgi:hypothetical protein